MSLSFNLSSFISSYFLLLISYVMSYVGRVATVSRLRRRLGSDVRAAASPWRPARNANDRRCSSERSAERPSAKLKRFKK